MSPVGAKGGGVARHLRQDCNACRARLTKLLAAPPLPTAPSADSHRVPCLACIADSWADTLDDTLGPLG